MGEEACVCNVCVEECVCGCGWGGGGTSTGPPRINLVLDFEAIENIAAVVADVVFIFVFVATVAGLPLLVVAGLLFARVCVLAGWRGGGK